MERLIAFVLVLILCGCNSKKTSSSFEEGKKLAEITNKNLSELSGLVASPNNPDHFWTHNDSGNKAEIYLIDRALNIKLTCRLSGATNRDWEDITIGPGPQGEHYIYVGDIGDNLAQYRYKIIYRFKEPAYLEGDSKITITEFETFVFSLPDKVKDTESLLFDPQTQNIFTVSKREKPVVVYQMHFVPSDTTTAEVVGTLNATQIVSGAFSSDGSELLLKNYNQIFYWKRDNGESLKSLIARKAELIPYTPEPQGEAITFARDGSGFYTISEKVKGEKSYLQFYKKRD
jgi:hypothetical protein